MREVLKFAGNNNPFSDGLGDADSLGIPSVSLDNSLETLVSLALYTAGVLSVVFIIVGGIFYAISGGDPGRIRQAKDTILWAVIGLAISGIALVIVRFVTDNLF